MAIIATRHSSRREEDTKKDEHFYQFDPKNQGDPLTFVISANLHRRHLTESQRATIAAKIVTMNSGDIST